MPGRNAEVYVQLSKTDTMDTITAMSISQLSEEQYTALYLLVNDDGLHIGIDGYEPFISVQNITGDLPSVQMVRFDGISQCSCENDPPCTSGFISSNWVIPNFY